MALFQRHRNLSSILYRSSVIAAVGLLAACEGQPGGPSGVVHVVSLEVVGPDTLDPGRLAQFVAMVRRTDGTTRPEISGSNLKWRSSNTSVATVSNTGLVTAVSMEFGEAVITAEITPGTVRGSRKVANWSRSKAAVKGTFEVTQQGSADQMSYVFSPKLTEFAGVAATVTDLSISFDDGWGGQCAWTSDKLGQTRLPAGGTLMLDPLTCGGSGLSGVVVAAGLKDDNGNVTTVYLSREPVVR